MRQLIPPRAAAILAPDQMAALELLDRFVGKPAGVRPTRGGPVPASRLE